MPSPEIPIRGRYEPEGPPYGGLGVEGWAQGMTFLQFVEDAGAYQEEIRNAFASVDLPADLLAFYTTFERHVRVLALADTGSSEARIHVAQAERLFTLGPGIWMRIFAPDRNPELRKRYAGEKGTPNPFLVFFGEDRREFGRWGPRPEATLAPGRDAGDADRVRLGREMALELRRILEKHPRPGPA